MLTPLEAGLQADPCLFIDEGEEEGPGGCRCRDRNVITKPVQTKQKFKVDWWIHILWV